MIVIYEEEGISCHYKVENLYTCYTTTRDILEMSRLWQEITNIYMKFKKRNSHCDIENENLFINYHVQFEDILKCVRVCVY